MLSSPSWNTSLRHLRPRLQGDRQLWWFGTVVATGLGLYWIAVSARRPLRIGGSRLLAAAARNWCACRRGREYGSSFPCRPIRSCLTGCNRRLLAHARDRGRLSWKRSGLTVHRALASRLPLGGQSINHSRCGRLASRPARTDGPRPCIPLSPDLVTAFITKPPAWPYSAL
jgi:hypothetical protein